jgi:hypothetical protein
MNAFVRNVWRDLVDKRLWPVALVLVLALVAIPVVLANEPPKSAAPATPVASADPPALVATPAAIRSNTGGAPVEGEFKDPFHQQHLPKAPAEAKASATSTKAPGGGGDGKSSSGGGSGNSNGSSGSHRSAQSGVTSLKVKFGLANGKRTTKTITPGSPLPAASNPLIVFLDFGTDGQSPVFLISSDVVKTEGDGVCRPSKAICSELSLREGTTQFFDLANGDQYQLDVVSVIRH